MASYAETLKRNGMGYDERLHCAVNRWLGTDRRSLVEILNSDLTDDEIENACDSADLYDVAASDVVFEIGNVARAEVLSERSDKAARS